VERDERKGKKEGRVGMDQEIQPRVEGEIGLAGLERLLNLLPPGKGR